jgi:hypothetical protein
MANLTEDTPSLEDNAGPEAPGQAGPAVPSRANDPILRKAIDLLRNQPAAGKPA